MSSPMALPDVPAAGGNAAEQNTARESGRERDALQYLLGVYVKSTPAPRKEIRRKAFYPDAVHSLERAVRAVHTQRRIHLQFVRGRGHVQVNSLRLIRKLYEMWLNFDSHINSDGARKRFLKGYLDFSYSKVLYHNDTLEYNIHILPSTVREKLLESFFELDVYPSPHASRITISTYHNIVRFRALDLAPALHSKEVDRYLAAYAWPHMSLPEMYYSVRSRVAEAYRQERLHNHVQRKGRNSAGGKNSEGAFKWADISRESGIQQDTLRRWSVDIARQYGDFISLGPGKPAVVRCYEALLTRFGLPNVYTSTVPVQRHEKLFLPINGKKYCLDRSMQQRYFQMYELPHEPLTEEHRRHLHSELESYLTGRINDIRFSLKETTVTGMWLSKGW